MPETESDVDVKNATRVRKDGTEQGVSHFSDQTHREFTVVR
jgi:hypothetical protein